MISMGLGLGACFDPPNAAPDDDATSSVGSTTGPDPDTGSTDPTNVTNTDTGPAPECTQDADCGDFDAGCVVGVCDDGTCITQDLPNGTGCDDEQACTTDDQCQGGVCGGTPVECETTDACRMGACNETTGRCEQVPDSALDGTDCDDGDPCTTDGVCDAGACAGAVDACAALDSECAVGMCGPMGCTAMPLNEGGPCDVANSCADSSCVMGSCTVIQALNENATCDDGLFCTAYERCIAGMCTPGPDFVCPADVGCGAWACDDAADACVVAAANEGNACNDGLSCTAATTCQMGQCEGMGPMTLFAEDFADNTAGWGLGPEWEIGPAVQTPCDQELMCNVMASSYPGGDPDLDHTPTDDNGVAGVAIGGFVNQSLHGFYYLSSPPFNGNVPGPVVLSFWRWLNSDYTPFMENRVEVWNGTAWIVVWASGPSPPIADAPWSTQMPAMGWSYQEFDLTAYKNGAMQVRFGFNVAQDGVYPAPGWNVDDVLVASTGCVPG